MKVKKQIWPRPQNDWMFYGTLDPSSRKRYIAKIELIGNKDPHILSENEFSLDFHNFYWHPTLTSKFVCGTSPYSAKLDIWKST